MAVEEGQKGGDDGLNGEDAIPKPVEVNGVCGENILDEVYTDAGFKGPDCVVEVPNPLPPAGVIPPESYDMKHQA